jgi:hypothetical protein
MGGTLTVESRLSQGSTFTLTLPLPSVSPHQASQDPRPSSDIRPEPEQQIPLPESQSSPKTVHAQAMTMLPGDVREQLQGILEGLKANCDIFDPAQLYTFAEQLTPFAWVQELQTISQHIYTVADTFDDQALQPIIKDLEEVLAAYGEEK